MKTLNEYVLDAQHKEARFVTDRQKPMNSYVASRNAQAHVQSVLTSDYVYVTRQGVRIPCANMATYKYYKEKEEAGEIVQ